MTGVKTGQRVSYSDLEKWPDDGRRYELYDGEVYEVPSPILLHQYVAGRLYSALDDYTRQHGGLVAFAPLDIVLTEYDVVQPDLLLFTAGRVPFVDFRKANRIPPDLAIEILSPGTEQNDRGRKMRLLARHGVREYWLVDPDPGRVEVYTLQGERFTLTQTASGDEPIRSTLLPDLEIRPKDLLPPPGS
jgi:Uma2 family endonuclease